MCNNIAMKDKYDITQRERKNYKKTKAQSSSKYSSKHIRNYEELMNWKKNNNRSKGSKSRHI